MQGQKGQPEVIQEIERVSGRGAMAVGGHGDGVEQARQHGVELMSVDRPTEFAI